MHGVRFAKNIFILFLFIGFATLVSCRKSAIEKAFPVGGSGQKLSTGASTTIQQYYLYLPKDYYSSGKPYPVIFFLHGGAQIGSSDINVLTKIGVPQYALANGDFPAIVIAPLLTNAASTWVISDLDKMFYEVASMYRIDASRIHSSGFSLGGGASWIWASSHPDVFASLNPIGCYADNNICNLKSVPVWDFHNRYDLVFHLENIQASIDQLKACGGNVNFTIYDEGGHEGWTRAYNDPALYDWILAQHK